MNFQPFKPMQTCEKMIFSAPISELYGASQNPGSCRAKTCIILQRGVVMVPEPSLGGMWPEPDWELLGSKRPASLRGFQWHGPRSRVGMG